MVPYPPFNASELAVSFRAVLMGRLEPIFTINDANVVNVGAEVHEVAERRARVRARDWAAWLLRYDAPWPGFAAPLMPRVLLLGSQRHVARRATPVQGRAGAAACAKHELWGSLLVRPRHLQRVVAAHSGEGAPLASMRKAPWPPTAPSLRDRPYREGLCSKSPCPPAGEAEPWLT